jgi:hypothetical protein
MTASVESPWMTVTETALYAKRHEQTVFKALWKYVRTDGREGLRGGQPNGPCSSWRVHREDIDLWLRGGQPPPRRARSSLTANRKVGRPT